LCLEAVDGALRDRHRRALGVARGGVDEVAIAVRLAGAIAGQRRGELALGAVEELVASRRVERRRRGVDHALLRNVLLLASEEMHRHEHRERRSPHRSASWRMHVVSRRLSTVPPRTLWSVLFVGCTCARSGADPTSAPIGSTRAAAATTPAGV